MLIFFVFIVIGISFYFLNRHYKYWLNRGILGPKPLYILGNVKDSFLLKKSTWEIYANIYNEYRNLPIVGIFRGSSPALIIRDPEIIKDIAVKSFNNFVNNDNYLDKNVDVIFGRNLFFLKDTAWKTARAQLTPGFTAVKMKWLYPLLEDMSKRLVEFIANEPSALNGKGYQSKELCMRFTLNNVATCAFGIEAKCFEEENSEFRQIADKFLTTGSLQSIKYFVLGLIPFLSKFITVKVVAKDTEQKLIDIVSQTLQYRKVNGISRNDFLQILQQLTETPAGSNLTNIDITGHAASFLVDGYDTSSLVMTFILYELARNPECQKKVREEINNGFAENDNTLPYTVLLELPYLDAVFNEALRLHPVLGALQKLCTKSYVLQNANPLVVEPGTIIIFPLFGLHRDPQYFENPNTFYPERFIGMAKERINKYVYMPFGEGPRACIGQRFGILQIKLGLAYILKHFEVYLNKKTIQPIKYDPIYWLTTVQGGVWLDFEKIV